LIVSIGASDNVKGADLASNSLSVQSPYVTLVASTDASWTPLFDASVIFTSAPNR
jgi:hypothetical protein